MNTITHAGKKTTLIDSLDKPHRVIRTDTMEVYTIYAPSREGALLAVSLQVFGLSYWENHPVTIEEDYYQLGIFRSYNKGI